MLAASQSWLGQSMIMSRRKGLSNELGENNCFLNVIIQSLWHLRSCRVLISTGDHALHHRFGGKPTPSPPPSSLPGGSTASTLDARGTGGACLLCELEQIFIQYQFAEEPVLDVDRVRAALSSVFQLGAMNDATETLEAILDALHWDTFNRMLTLRRGVCAAQPRDLSQSTVEDASAIVCEPQCIAHLLFQMNLMELKSCRQCGETTEPQMNTDFLYRVYAQELLQFAKGKSLEDVLRLEAQGGCISPECRPSCDACAKTTKAKSKMELSRWILQLPMVFATSVIWASDHVSKQDVKSWLELLTTQNSRAPSKKSKDGDDDDNHRQTLDLGKIFRVDQSSQASAEYAFRGMVCYYGRHYVGFFKSRSVENGKSQERWFLFDDTRVKRLGAWDEVRSRIERGGYQPTLLFYERKGLEKEKLQQVAAEIHRWWEESADASEDQAATSTTDSAASTKSPRSPSAPAAAPQPAAAAVAPSLPYSPINATSATSSTHNGSAKSPSSSSSTVWHDDHLTMMHRSAQDTLSRLNGILSRDVTPTPSTANASGDAMRMSVAMPRSVRRREYSVRRMSEDVADIDRDTIFQDDVDVLFPPLVSAGSSPLPPLKPQQQQPQATIVKHPSPLATAMQKLTMRDQQDQQTSADGSEVLLASQTFDVTLSASDGGLGLVLEEQHDVETPAAPCNFVVSAFEMNGAGEQLAAEASGAIQIGDRLLAINNTELLVDQKQQRTTLYEVLETLLTAPNPVVLTFQRLLPWNCPRCTLLNDVAESSCAACGHKVYLQRGTPVKQLHTL